MKESRTDSMADTQKTENNYALRYGLFGVGLGLIFPLLGMILTVFIQALPFSLASLIQTQRTQPLLWIIDTAPFFLGLFAALIGRREDQLDDSKKHLEDLISTLEKRVAERTNDLTLASEVSLRVLQVRDINILLNEAVTLIQDRFDLYHAQIYLTDGSKRNLVLRASTGIIGQTLLERAHYLPIGAGSINGTAAMNKEAVIVSDTEESPIFYANPMLPETRSEMAMPLLVGGEVVGVLDLQSKRPIDLSSERLPMFESLAGQLAIAIDIASQIETINESQSQLFEHSRRITREGWQAFLDNYSWREQVSYVFDGAKNTLESSNPFTPTKETKSFPVELLGAVIGWIQVELDDDQGWSASSESLVKSVADQVAQQVENLRLLAEAEQYRMEAEAATRRLIREGWEGYMGSAVLANEGYRYDQSEVLPINVESITYNNTNVVRQELLVHGEEIGSLDVLGVEATDIETAEMVAAVARQLSAHIENLRLTTQTEAALAETAEQARRRKLLNEVSEQLNRANTLEEIYDIIAEGTAHILPCDRVSLSILNEVGDEYTIMSLVGDGKTMPVGAPQPLADSTIERAIKSAATIVTHNVGPNSESVINSSMVAPLITNVGAIGTLNVGSQVMYYYDEDDQALILQIASILSTVIENKRLLKEAQDRAEELALINQVVAEVSASLDVEQNLQIVADELARATGVDAVGIALLNQGKRSLTVVAEHLESKRAGSNLGFVIPVEGNVLTQEVLNTRKTVFVEDAQNHSLTEPVHQGMRMRGVNTLYVVPMLAGNEIIGTVGLDILDKGRFLSSQQVDLAETLVIQAATAVQNARLFAESEQRAAELSLINAVSELASSQLELSGLFTSVGQTLQDTFAAENVYFALFDTITGKITFPYYFSREEGALEIEPHPLEQGGYTGQIITTRKSLLRVIEPETTTEQLQREGANLVGSGRIADSYLGTPMIVGNEIVGVIGLSSYREVRTYNQQDQQLLETMADTLGVAVQNIRQFQEAQRRAQRETLLRQVAERVRGSSDVDTVMRTAVQEVGRVLGRRTYIYLEDQDTEPTQVPSE